MSTDEVTATHAKQGKWTPTRNGEYEIFVVKKTRYGVLAHVRKIDKKATKPVELQAEEKT